MLILHGIPNCDTVRKARAWLDGRGTRYRFRDFRKEPPALDELAQWADAAGWEVLLNRRGTTFRGLPEEDRSGIDREKALRLMAQHPSLIKRPVVTGGDGQVSVGFAAEQFERRWG
jgi:arsenate reductase